MADLATMAQLLDPRELIPHYVALPQILDYWFTKTFYTNVKNVDSDSRTDTWYAFDRGSSSPALPRRCCCCCAPAAGCWRPELPPRTDTCPPGA